MKMKPAKITGKYRYALRIWLNVNSVVHNINGTYVRQPAAMMMKFFHTYTDALQDASQYTQKELKDFFYSITLEEWKENLLPLPGYVVIEKMHINNGAFEADIEENHNGAMILESAFVEAANYHPIFSN